MSDADLLHTAWADLLAVAGELASRPVRPDLDAVDSVDAYRHLATLVAHAVDMFVLSRPDAPVFVRAFNHDEPSEYKFMGDNADTRYFYTNVSGDHRYRIRGRRGDEVYLSFVVHGGHGTDALEQRVVGVVNHRDIATDDDGTFEIVLSAERPEGDVTWLPLDPRATCILSREYYWDRSRARWATYTIERIDGPAAPLDADALATAMRDATAFLEVAMRPLAPRPVPANTFTPPFTFTTELPGWGTPDNTYCGCSFDLAEDEVLVVEGELVPSAYWNAQLWNIHMQSIGVPPSAASINRRQAGLGERDAFRFAVSARDPGIRPWLDTHGHRRGTVYVRWLCAEETPPTPRATVRTIG